MALPKYDDHHQSIDSPRTQIIGWWPALFLGLVGLLIVGVIWGPDWQRRWTENSREFIENQRREELAADVDVRKAKAQADADAAYRKREAEMKAEVDALVQRVKNRPIDPSPFRDVYRKVAPSVVRIAISPHGPEGSGVIFRIDDRSKQVFIVTNSHVVHLDQSIDNPRPKIADKITVTLASGRTVDVPGTQIHPDPHSDLAVLHFDGRDIPNLTAAEFALDGEPEQGDWAIAIGHPFGLTQTMTVGIISGVGRIDVGPGTLDAIDLIQTDAAVNPGNSGGPLLDIRGKVIGINTVILTKSGTSQGVGFAIPAKLVSDICEQLSVPPYDVTRGYLGVQMKSLTLEDAQKLGKQGGVVIEHVPERTPAWKAGLKSGDVIVSYAGKPVLGVGYLRRFVQDTLIDSTVEIGIVRKTDGLPVDLTVKAQITKRQ